MPPRRSLYGQASIGWDRNVGIWEHDSDYAFVERESFDFVDDFARDSELVLCVVLRDSEVGEALS